MGDECSIEMDHFLHELTYESASIGLFGGKVDAMVPMAGEKDPVHVGFA